MTESQQDARLPYAERIAKLLRKAENTEHEGEAELLRDKAQQLMTKYAISEELLAHAEGRQRTEEIIADEIAYHGIFQAALFNIGRAVARPNNCRVMISANVKTADGKATKMHLIGFESDVARVKLLDASIQIQASAALHKWYREQSTSWMSGMEKFKLRRQFLFGYAQGLEAKLKLANKAGVNDAINEEVDRLGVAADEVRRSTKLVLLSRQEQVGSWYDERYGRFARTVRRSYSSGGAAAANDGRAAGRLANTGQTAMGRSTRGELR